MARVSTAQKRNRIIEPAAGGPLVDALRQRVAQLEKLIRAIEDELSDDELDDEQKLQNIGERVAQATDGL